MKFVWRVCYVPVFEGQEKEEIVSNELNPVEDLPYFAVGVVAESIEDAIEKVEEEWPGKDLSKFFPDSDDDGEKWKKKSYIIEEVIVVGVELASSVHLES
jgi:hypothetical protein